MLDISPYCWEKMVLTMGSTLEIMEERGVNVDHATLNRWVMRQPLQQKLTLRNETQIDLGAWMKRISK
jgi:transposase-like protein